MPGATAVRAVVNHPITGSCLLDEYYPSIATAAVGIMTVMTDIPRPYRVTISNLRHWRAGPKSVDERGLPLGYQRDKFDPHTFIWIGPAVDRPVFSARSRTDLLRAERISRTIITTPNTRSATRANQAIPNTFAINRTIASINANNVTIPNINLSNVTLPRIEVVPNTTALSIQLGNVTTPEPDTIMTPVAMPAMDLYPEQVSEAEIPVACLDVVTTQITSLMTEFDDLLTSWIASIL